MGNRDSSPGRRFRSMSSSPKYVFGDDYIEFSNYPLRPSSVLVNTRVPRSSIIEVNLEADPLTVRIERELLLVTVEHAEALTRFVQERSIPNAERYDIWERILAPFLDTEFSQSELKTFENELGQFGIGANEIATARDLVRRKMLWRTLRSWNWQYYGLFDVLMTMQPRFFGQRLFSVFYWYAMSVALLSYKTAPTSSPGP